MVSDIGGYYDGQSIVRCEGSNTISLVFHHSHNHEVTSSGPKNARTSRHSAHPLTARIISQHFAMHFRSSNKPTTTVGSTPAGRHWDSAVGAQGGAGLRVYHSTSEDSGLTWSRPEPLEASLTMPSHDSYQFVHPSSNRVYVVYGYNDGQLDCVDPKTGLRVDLPRGDMQLDEGFRFRYSDDGGKSFCDTRFTIPVRRTAIDRANPWGGSTMGAFQCDKPSIIGNSVYFAFQKTVEGGGETHGSECWIMRSKDLLQLSHDPAAGEPSFLAVWMAFGADRDGRGEWSWYWVWWSWYGDLGELVLDLRELVLGVRELVLGCGGADMGCEGAAPAG